MSEHKTILQYPLEQRRKIRKGLERAENLAKKQKELLFELWLKPHNDRLKVIKDFRENKITNTQYLYTLARINKHLEDLYKTYTKH